MNELFLRSKKVTPGGVHSPVRAFKSVGGEPIFFDKAKGASLISVEGKSYIDYCQSFGPLILGHLDPEVSQAVLETTQKAWSLGTCETYSLELAEWMAQRIPWVEKLRFVCSGTEAVMSVLRLARAATQRKKILKFEGCYHGHVDSMLVKAGSGLAGSSASDSAGIPDEISKNTLICPLDDELTLKNIFEREGSQIAAVIIEPLPANYGLLIQKNSFLKLVAELSKSCGALLIFDEVISGFRVAIGGMAEVLDIRPDLVTYGKIIGGGFPVGCFAGRSELMDMMAPSGPVYQAGTLAANSVGMKAGLATLQKIERLNIFPLLEKRTASLAKEIENLGKNHGVKVSHFGSLFWIHFSNQKEIRSPREISSHHTEKFSHFFHKALKYGIYFAPSGYEVGFLSLSHTEDVLDQTLKCLRKVFEEIP